MHRVLELTEMYPSVEAIETEHDRNSANKRGFNVVIPTAPIEEVLKHLGTVCLRRQIPQHNEQDEETHDKDDKGSRFDSGQETPEDCSHEHGHRDNCKECQRHVPLLHFILGVDCTGQAKDHIRRQEGHSGSTSLPCDGDNPAHKVGQEV